MPLGVCSLKPGKLPSGPCRLAGREPWRICGVAQPAPSGEITEASQEAQRIFTVQPHFSIRPHRPAPTRSRHEARASMMTVCFELSAIRQPVSLLFWGSHFAMLFARFAEGVTFAAADISLFFQPDTTSPSPSSDSREDRAHAATGCRATSDQRRSGLTVA